MSQFHWPSLDVTPRGGCRYPNEQVWTGLQWSSPDVTSRGSQVWGPGGVCPRSDVQGACTVKFNASWVMITQPSPHPPWKEWLTDRPDWNYYLPAILLAGGNKWNWRHCKEERTDCLINPERLSMLFKGQERVVWDDCLGCHVPTTLIDFRILIVSRHAT